MRVLGAAVQVATGPVLHLGRDIVVRNSVAAKTVGDEALWLVLQPSEQVLEEALRGCGIPAILDQDIEDKAVLIKGAPKIMELVIDFQEYFIEVPSVARLGPATAKL